MLRRVLGLGELGEWGYTAGSEVQQGGREQLNNGEISQVRGLNGREDDAVLQTSDDVLARRNWAGGAIAYSRTRRRTLGGENRELGYLEALR